jgi:hypothetical protein
MPTYNGYELSRVENTNYTLNNQVTVPSCAPLPPTCTIGTVSISITNPALRGGNDGSITVVISGTTGSTSNMEYALNGNSVTITGALTGHTFTGLSAGEYTIYYTQAPGTPFSETCYITEEGLLVLDGEFRTGDFFVTQPTGLTAVENPIIIQVQTKVTSSSPERNSVALTLSGTIANNNSITFNLTSPFIYNQTFYAKGFPNKPNYFLATTLTDASGVPQGTNTLDEIAVSLSDALNNDSVIPKVYNINVNGSVVSISAKETGSKFNLTSANVTTTGTIALTTIQTGVDYCDGQATDNYSISCEVMANTDNTTQYPEVGQLTDYNLVSELILPFNQVNNIHKFDISNILKSQVDTPKPSITLTGSTLLMGVMQPYYTKLNELYPLIANTNTIKKRFKTNTSVQWVINSSLDRFSPNNMENYLGVPITDLNPNFDMAFSFNIGTTVVLSDTLLGIVSGTTNVMYAIYDDTNTTKLKNWQTGLTFTLVTAGVRYARVSGTTNGRIDTFSRSMMVSQYSQSADRNIYPSKYDSVSFLTNSPNPKQIQRNSNEFIYFVLPKDYGTSLKMKGDLYFYDGTSATGQTFFTIATGATNAGGCLVMNLSYDKLGLQNYEVSGTTNRKIKRADLAVYQAYNGYDIPYTDSKEYRFEIDEQPRKFGILFQNALGMYDAFDFVGVVETTVSRDNSLYTVPLTFNPNGSLLQGFKNQATYNTKIVKKVIVNTGWIDSAHFQWLQELLKSNNIYSTSITNQNYLNLTEFTYKASSLDDLFDAEFTFEFTIFENAMTV